MDVVVLIGIVCLIFLILGNIRFFIGCALLAVAAGVYYQHLERSEQRKWEKTYEEYKQRCTRAYKAFNQ